jgi:hypothetical protein
MIIDFEKSIGNAIYKGTLDLPDGIVFSEAEIESMKQQQFESWLKGMGYSQPIYLPEA